MNTTNLDRPADVSEGDVNLGARRAEYVQGHPASTRDLLHRDAEVFLHQSLSTPCMNTLQGARGTVLVDGSGRSILDFHGNSVHQVGHAHPRVVEAVRRQLEELCFCPRRFTCSPAVRLAERLGELAGGDLSKVLLAPGGAQAMGIALKLARVATGRFKTVSMWGSFHGASLDTISIGGEAVFRRGMGPLLPGAEHAPPCAPSTCALNCEGSCNLACARSLCQILEREGDIGAVIAEPVRCTTVDIPPAEYWPAIREACDKAGALLIFDEIPTCLGRTGRTFAYEHYGVRPDIVVLGKGLGGGVMPQAAVIARRNLDVCGHGALGHYTHEKSPLGAAAALATLDVIRDEKLVVGAGELGERWIIDLRHKLKSSSIVREVRGLGLLVGIEITHHRGGRTRADLCDAILHEALRRGVSFKVSDGRVLTLTPPLTIDERELEIATQTLILCIALAENGEI